MAKPVHIGCSGWNYRDWRGAIYPEGLPARRWLERYAELFDTVEVNNTFYRLPSQSAVEGWVEQTPPGFVIAVKASRYLTHVKRLREMTRAATRYFKAIKPLADSSKLGPVLWQLPANFKRDDERLGAALARASGGASLLRVSPPELVRPGGVRAPAAPPSRARDRRRPGAPLPEPRDHHRLDATSASTAETAGAGATTPSGSSRIGSAASRHGAPTSRSSPTSTTTGRPSPRATRCGWRSGSVNRAWAHGRAALPRLAPPPTHR